MPDTVFNNLGHVITVEFLRDAYQELSGTKALGVDKVSKQAYGANLVENLQRLWTSIRTGKYRPQAARLVEIPKEDGSTRPLAISCFEDKIVQSAVNKILTQIYEPMFLPSSYGFRPNKSCHDALKALTKASYRFKDGAVVEVDIRQCFDMIPHAPLMNILSEKILDKRFLTLLRRLITIPVLEGGSQRPTRRGCPQGSILSPILANIYLHHVLDQWFAAISKTHFAGQAEMIRYADDMVFVFEKANDAKRFFDVIGKRLSKYGLSLHEGKSRFLESGSTCAKRKEACGERMPTYSFLGFTCYWGKAQHGKFWRLKYTSRRDRFTASLKEKRKYLGKNLNTPDTRAVLEGLVKQITGWINYHAISDNARRVSAYLYEVRRMIFRWFNRKSQRKPMTWDNLDRWLERVKYPKTVRITSMFARG